MEGVLYNFYFIKAEKKTIIEPAKSIKVEEYIDRINEISGISGIDSFDFARAIIAKLQGR